ncbi:MAG: hypothetical protein HUU54_10835 [Ignavibacteriaceae bacterium]|nr:hypothetical protein [Ignavibacteriaceae bacterium]
MIKQGSRKFIAFMITVFLFTVVVIITAALLKHDNAVLPSFVFQLASAYGILCGLFFGSNVLEHYSGRGKRENE